MSGELVKVAFARTQVEAEMIQGLLEADEIPSLLRALGVDGSKLGFAVLATSPQQVMVRADQAEKARALLAEALIPGEEGAGPEIANARHLEDVGGRKPRSYGVIGFYAGVCFWGLGLMIAGLGIFLLLRAV